jgi:hypothetical protein
MRERNVYMTKSMSPPAADFGQKLASSLQLSVLSKRPKSIILAFDSPIDCALTHQILC